MQVENDRKTSDVFYGRSLSHILVNLHNATVASRLSKTEPNENATKFINPLTTLLLGQELQLSMMYSTFVYIVLLLYDEEYGAVELRTRQTLLQAPSLSYQLLVIHVQYTVLLIFLKHSLDVAKTQNELGVMLGLPTLCIYKQYICIYFLIMCVRSSVNQLGFGHFLTYYLKACIKKFCETVCSSDLSQCRRSPGTGSQEGL